MGAAEGCRIAQPKAVRDIVRVNMLSDFLTIRQLASFAALVHASAVRVMATAEFCSSGAQALPDRNLIRLDKPPTADNLVDSFLLPWDRLAFR